MKMLGGAAATGMVHVKDGTGIIRVLFVCTGNTCRSTMCEAITKHLLKQRNLQNYVVVDSAGVSNKQVGSPVDPRTVATLKKHNIDVIEHTARQITREDFNKFHYILGMDDFNMRTLRMLQPNNCLASINYLTSFNPLSKHREIPDPYEGDLQTYNDTFNFCFPACFSLLNVIRESLSI